MKSTYLQINSGSSFQNLPERFLLMRVRSKHCSMAEKVYCQPVSMPMKDILKKVMLWKSLTDIHASVVEKFFTLPLNWSMRWENGQRSSCIIRLKSYTEINGSKFKGGYFNDKNNCK